jgi:hypothetical protein
MVKTAYFGLINDSKWSLQKIDGLFYFKEYFVVTKKLNGYKTKK